MQPEFLTYDQITFNAGKVHTHITMYLFETAFGSVCTHCLVYMHGTMLGLSFDEMLESYLMYIAL